MSDFCREDEACHASVTMGEGPREVVRLWRMVNLGCNVAIKSEPFWYLWQDRVSFCTFVKMSQKPCTYPMAKVLQSAAGAMAVIAIWSMVLADMCSDVVGSKRITLPWVLPVCAQLAMTIRRDEANQENTHQTRHCRCASKQRRLDFHTRQISQPHLQSSGPTQSQSARRHN